MLLLKEWFTAAELADLALPGMPNSKRGIGLRAEGDGWTDPQREWDAAANPCGQWRERVARGGGIEYHYSLLPADAQAKLVAAHMPAPAMPDPKEQLSAEQAWEWFDTQSEKAREKAAGRLNLLRHVEALTAAGHSLDVAIALAIVEVSRSNPSLKVSPRSVWRWRDQVAGLHKKDWLPALADRHSGGGAAAEIEPEAWELFKADYLRLEAPTLSACYRRVARIAKERGWRLPTEKSFARRIARDISPTILTLARKGQQALKETVKPLKRDRSHFHALEAINGDGHKWDVFVRFDDGTPDGFIGRAVMTTFQDLYSGKVVAWRIDRSENQDVIRLALGDVLEQFGLPAMIWFDNTRAFANKQMTGWVPHRFRFKQREEDARGLCSIAGIEVRWTKPYSGQSKPIERVFRDYAQDIAKHPAFAGAYVGNKPTAKPENYRSKAIPFDEFCRVVSAEIHEWNARTGRRTDVAKGRSFDQVFEESYRQADALIAKPSEAMIRLFRLAADGIRADRKNGTVRLMDNEYWASWLSDYAGRELVVRVDPHNLHDGAHIYDKAGHHLGFAPVTLAAGFNDAEAARRQAKLRGEITKAKKAQLAAIRKLDALDVARALPTSEPAGTPKIDHTVVRHNFRSRGSAALSAKPSASEEWLSREDAELDRRSASILKLVQPSDDI